MGNAQLRQRRAGPGGSRRPRGGPRQIQKRPGWSDERIKKKVKVDPLLTLSPGGEGVGEGGISLVQPFQSSQGFCSIFQMFKKNERVHLHRLLMTRLPPTRIFFSAPNFFGAHGLLSGIKGKFILSSTTLRRFGNFSRGSGPRSKKPSTRWPRTQSKGFPNCSSPTSKRYHEMRCSLGGKY